MNAELGFMEAGYPSMTKDINGRMLCLGDLVGYKGGKEEFEIVFEGNAFRKKYKGWDDTLEKPMLEYGLLARHMGIVWKASPWQS